VIGRRRSRLGSKSSLTLLTPMRHQANGMNRLVLIIERDVALTCCGAKAEGVYTRCGVL
jgi:hypothetical protein